MIIVKLLLSAILLLVMLFASSWVFNHINPWLSFLCYALSISLFLYFVGVLVNKVFKS